MNIFIFKVNTKKCGKGILRCMATYPDGSEAFIKKEQVAHHIYRITIFVHTTNKLDLYIDHIPVN
jgi:hypothetical protein